MHTDFRRAFTHGALFWDPDRRKTLKVAVTGVGEISFPTGQVVVADPSFVDDSESQPLPRRAPIGRWPAEVTLATEEGSAFGTVAAMRVRFGPAAALRWTPALTNEAGEVLAVGVDGGRIAMFDLRVLERATPDTIFSRCFGGAANASVVEFPNTSEIFVSDAGKGDGAYPVWWGMTDDGEAVELVVEFDVLVRTSTRWIEIPAELLNEQGMVMDPELAMAGVTVEVVTADDVRGPWTWDYSSFPAETRPHYERPTIGVALRLKGSVGMVSLRDSSGRAGSMNPASIGPGDDGFRTLFWEADPRLASAHTLALEIVEETQPLGPPPSTGI